MSDDYPLGSFTGTPADALGPTVRETVIVAGKTFLLHRPDAVDRLLDHPAVQAAFGADEYMPYWADLWPAARMLAKAIVREPWPQTGGPLEALEIGCGLGLPGVAALSCGLKVIFTDYDETALRFAADNARINGYENFETLRMDWRNPPDRQFPVLLGSDLIYEIRSVDPVINLIKRLLRPDGVCLLADGDRWPSTTFRERLAEEKFSVATSVVHAGEPGGRRHKGTLYRIKLPAT